VKQASSDPRENAFAGGAGDYQESDGHGLLNGLPVDPTANSDPKDDGSHQTILEGAELDKIKHLPKEVGVVLITAGIVGFILPGPGTPAIIAGGLALWPKAFGKLESWVERRYPRLHRRGMQQIHRFLDDLEKRYPNSTQN
jgi:hypothetical protein